MQCRSTTVVPTRPRADGDGTASPRCLATLGLGHVGGADNFACIWQIVSSGRSFLPRLSWARLFATSDRAKFAGLVWNATVARVVRCAEHELPLALPAPFAFPAWNCARPWAGDRGTCRVRPWRRHLLRPRAQAWARQRHRPVRGRCPRGHRHARRLHPHSMCRWASAVVVRADGRAPTEFALRDSLVRCRRGKRRGGKGQRRGWPCVPVGGIRWCVRERGMCAHNVVGRGRGPRDRHGRERGCRYGGRLRIGPPLRRRNQCDTFRSCRFGPGECLRSRCSRQ